jgi:exopolyphosphatase/guanosine-5'-triphosphate,3'-diphosphate pyrophosphatase
VAAQMPLPLAPDEVTRAHGREGPRPVGIVDIGSNSIRLVVYDGLRRSPFPLFNEKVLCGLGRDLEASGRLDREAAERALDELARFAALCRALGIQRPQVIATAAVRDAADGSDFVAAVRRRCGLVATVLSGAEEARLSALGVVSAFPAARGIMGDLGGGSLELVAVGEGTQGEHATLPLGVLRLAAMARGRRRGLPALIDRHLAALPWLADRDGGDLYAVGGSWRSFARAHMDTVSYPVHVIHHYAVPRVEALAFARWLVTASRQRVAGLPSVPHRRRDVLPLAALVMQRILERANPARVVFSAYGVREGCLLDRLSGDARAEDPLIAGTREIADIEGRFGPGAAAIDDWLTPLFASDCTAEGRLRRAACLLSDVGWHEHPDYRAEHAFFRILRLPIVGIDHPGRAFIAFAVASRYGRVLDSPFTASVAGLLPTAALERARRLGLAMRLAYTLSAGSPEILRRAALTRDGQRLTLAVANTDAALAGDVVRRRFDVLAQAMGLAAAIEILPPTVTRRA